MASNFNFTWTPNPSLFENLKSGEFITSRRFTTVKNHVNYTWCLKLYPKGLKIGEVNHSDPQLTCVFITGPKDVIFFNRYPNMSNRLRIEVLEKTNESVYLFEIDTVETETISEATFQPSLNNNPITLRLIINKQLFDPFFLLPDAIEPIAASPFDRLLVKVLSGEENRRSNFSIIAENHIYATDSNILFTRCPFFERFFDNAGEDWAEQTANQLSAPFCKQVMDEIFSYIYTDRVNVPEFTNVELIRELVRAADYFQLYELKKHYERPLLTYLIQNTSGMGALAAFIFADRYDFKVLKNVSLTMLSEHYDSIEDAVKTQKAAASASKQEICFGESEDILALWDLLKKNCENHTSLFDELFAFIRQNSSKIADTLNCYASSHAVLV
uniref:BTB domain-containing protein n=1 Tax=Plectus sambesii TaxID=2011161 RepID=A0A914W4Y6_9BILA